MENVRLMDRPDDFARLGINPDKVEPWEDGRRGNDGEVWYFDGILDDGTKFVTYFHPKSFADMAAADAPDMGVLITTPDGAGHGTMLTHYPAEESHFGTDKCDVKVGPHTATGDFASYDVHVEPIEGTGLDLHFEAIVKPYRQGTAILALGDKDEYHYSDLSVVKSIVTGTITVDGATRQVSGTGYHDHQWMNIMQFQAWHHWLWGHLYTEHYTVLIYDFVANQRFGFKAVPLFGVMDNRTGEVVFSTDGNFTRATTLEHQDTLDRDFPKVSEYTFTNADGSSVEFRVEWTQELETRDMYTPLPDEQKAQMDAAGLKPVYMRYYADGRVTLTAPDGSRVSESGDMIYEYPYIGVPDERADV